MDVANTDERINYFTVESPLHWDDYFMLQAVMASYRSKDPNTKVGCVFVNQDNRQIAMGYNGSVAGIDESQIPWGNDLSVARIHQKYAYLIHAESNAIAHAQQDLRNSRLYVSLFPCNECAKLIATLKVGEVIYLSDKNASRDETIIAKRIFDLASVPFRQHRLDLPLIDKFSKYLKAVSQDRPLQDLDL